MLTAFDRQVADAERELCRREIAKLDRYCRRADLSRAQREAAQGMRGALLDQITTITLAVAQADAQPGPRWLRATREAMDVADYSGEEAPYLQREA